MQTERQRDAIAVAAEHRREPPAKTAPVDLHVGARPERRKNLCALRFAQAGKIQLVVIANELAPGAPGRNVGTSGQGLDDRSCVMGGEGEKEALGHQEIEHHMETIAGSEIRRYCGRRHVGLADEHRVAVDGVAHPAQR